MSMIKTFNSTVSKEINQKGDFYEVWFGQDPFIPEVTIIESEDFNCGALCNELEFAREVSNYFVDSLDIALADDTELADLINTFIDLPRRGTFEADTVFRNRFKFISVQKAYTKRTTKWAILESISYFIADSSSVQLIEIFDSFNLYFQIRLEGVVTTDDIIFLNNLEQGWIDQNFIGGPGLGAVITYLADLIQRIKAAGVDFDVVFVEQDRFTKTADATIGTIQYYLPADARIKAAITFTKASDATIT